MGQTGYPTKRMDRVPQTANETHRLAKSRITSYNVCYTKLLRHFEAVVVNNKLYCIGGRRSSGVEKKVFEITVPEVDVFDFKTQKWRTLPTVIPTQRAGTTNVVSGNEIIVIGGESIAHKVAHNECEAYNVKTGLWRTLPHLVEGRHGTRITSYNVCYTKLLRDNL